MLRTRGGESCRFGLPIEAIAAWHAPATGERGGQPIYSAIAIETALTLRLVFHQPLRQTEGLLQIDRGSARHRNCNSRPHDIEPPRGGLTVLPKVVWSRRTSAASPHRQHWSEDLRRGASGWIRSVVFVPLGAGRKLHLGVDADTHEVVAVELTCRTSVGDVSQLAKLLDQVTTPIASVIGRRRI